MRKLASLSAFFPCYNEAQHVRAMADHMLAVLPRVANHYELIIVDDGSTDDTGEIADRIASSNGDVRVVHNRPNQGYGGALKAGFRAARFEYVFFTDGDCQYRPAELPRLVERAGEADMVLGYRIARADPPHRLVFGWLWGLLIRAAFGLRLRDMNCAFKLIPRHMLDGVELQSDGAFVSAELICRLLRRGCTYVEVGVHHYPQERGTGGSPRVILRALADLLRLWRRIRAGS